MGQLGEIEVVVGADVEPLVKGVAKAELALKKLPGASNQAANALQNLGRVAQDAPFGFIGIQNNLNPLLESFQRLRTESGSNAKALKALGASLIGPDGLGLALSVVSAAILLFQKYMGDAGDETKKASVAISDALSDSAASVSGNVSRLEALVSISKDVTKSDQARKEALGALNKEYDGFNGKLTLANINTKESADLINKQTDALVRQAQIRGLQDLITDETKKAAENARKDLSDNLTVLQRLQNVAVSVFSPSAGQGDAIVSGLKNRDKQLKESEKNIVSYKDVLKNLLGEDADAGTLFKEPKPKKAKEIKDKIIKALKLKPDDLEKMFFDEATIKLKVPVQAELDFKKGLRDNPFSSEGLTGILSDQALTEVNIKAQLAGLGITKGIQDGMNVGVNGLRFPELKALLDSSKERFAELQTNLNSAATTMVNDVFGSVGESLGKALADGMDLGDVFGSVFQIIGEGLKSMGKAMITYGTGIIVLKNAIKNPYLAIVAGVGLIALGSLLEAAIPKFAVGTQNFRGGLAMVGERGPELVNLPKGSGVIPNDKLAGINGGQSIQIYGEFVQRGQHLVAVINQTTKANGRAF